MQSLVLHSQLIVLCPSVELPFLKGVGYSRPIVLTVVGVKQDSRCLAENAENLLLSKNTLQGKSLVCLCSVSSLIILGEGGCLKTTLMLC